MDRRKVDHVEAHCRRVVDAAQAVAEGGGAVRLALGATREEFVPRGKAGGFAVHVDGHCRAQLGGGGPVAVGLHEDDHLRIVREAVHLGRSPGADGGGEFAEPGGVNLGSFAEGCRTFKEAGALLDFCRQFGEARLIFLVELVLPTGESVLPRLDGEFVRTDLQEAACRAPAVIGDELHRCLAPRIPGADLPPLEDGGGDVVSVLEDVGLDHQPLSHDALEREMTTIHDGADILNDDGGQALNVHTERCSGQTRREDARGRLKIQEPRFKEESRTKVRASKASARQVVKDLER